MYPFRKYARTSDSLSIDDVLYLSMKATLRSEILARSMGPSGGPSHRAVPPKMVFRIPYERMK